MAEYNVSYNGLTMGPNTDYPIVAVSGLWDRDVSLNMPNLPRYHGSIPGASYHTKRVIELTLEVTGDPDTDFTPNRREIMAAFQPQVDTELPLTFQLAGEDPKRVLARVARGTSLVNHETEFGMATFVFQLEASDPVIYDDALGAALLTPFEQSAGLSYFVNYPKIYGLGGSGAGTDVANDGDWETWPTFTIGGPNTGTMTDPIIENLTTGKKIELTAEGGVSMVTGQTLVIETHPIRRAINFTTGASRYGKLSTESEFWPLVPGINEIRFRAFGSTAGVTCDVSYRSAWI